VLYAAIPKHTQVPKLHKRKIGTRILWTSRTMITHKDQIFCVLEGIEGPARLSRHRLGRGTGECLPVCRISDMQHRYALPFATCYTRRSDVNQDRVRSCHCTFHRVSRSAPAPILLVNTAGAHQARHDAQMVHSERPREQVDPRKTCQ